MIYGIGTDIADIARLERLLTRHGEVALKKILAASELAEFPRRNPAVQGRFLARRWAAKEAFSKALGTGLCHPAILTNMAVTHDEAGRPFFLFAPVLARHLEELGLAAHLSISDEKAYALAFVVLERV
ncbi:MAG: holo-ACP synthase [Zoogloeaceae bacterium]|jgi:holo-[acyl-carrier protein] synthase|nr:holo-ACP synthase [Zoogloeaceae bacterium]